MRGVRFVLCVRDLGGVSSATWPEIGTVVNLEGRGLVQWCPASWPRGPGEGGVGLWA